VLTPTQTEEGTSSGLHVSAVGALATSGCSLHITRNGDALKGYLEQAALRRLAMDILRGAHGFQPYVCMQLYNRILRVTGRSRTKA
jgi:hypothetical protein